MSEKPAGMFGASAVFMKAAGGLQKFPDHLLHLAFVVGTTVCAVAASMGARISIAGCVVLLLGYGGFLYVKVHEAQLRATLAQRDLVADAQDRARRRKRLKLTTEPELPLPQPSESGSVRRVVTEGRTGFRPKEGGGRA